jgi:hypothetical protein
MAQMRQGMQNRDRHPTRGKRLTLRGIEHSIRLLRFIWQRNRIRRRGA